MQRNVLIYVDAMKLGDALVSLPILRAYKQAMPGDRLVLVAGRGKTMLARELAPLAAGVLDEIVEELPLSPRGMGAWLRRRHFDLWVDTQRRLADSLVMKAYAKWHGITFISATAHYVFSEIKPASGQLKPLSSKDQQIQLLELAAQRPLQVTWQSSPPLGLQQLAQRTLPAGQRYVGLCPGAADRRRCWPLDNFIALARHFSALGYTPVWLLGPQERDWEASLRAATPQALFPTYDVAVPASQSVLFSLALAGRLSLGIANDSGLGHLVAASGAPLVSLSRRADAGKWAPLASRLALLNARDHGGEAMAAIPLAEVIKAADALLQGPAG